MKKILSLLAVALFATTFAAGCGPKFTKCSQATKADDCKAENFDKEKDDLAKCTWDGTTCKHDPSGLVAADVTGKAACAKATDATACTAASNALTNKTTHKCEMVGTTCTYKTI